MGSDPSALGKEHSVPTTTAAVPKEPAPVERFLRILADVAILLVAALVVTVVVRNRELFFGRGATSDVGVGERVRIDGLDFSASRRTFVLALSTRCDHCAKDAGLYRLLAEQCGTSTNVRIVAAFQEPADQGRAWLEALSIPVSSVHAVNLPRLGIGGTPTILLVDSRGRLTKSWKGALDAETEVDVLKSIPQ